MPRAVLSDDDHSARGEPRQGMLFGGVGDSVSPIAPAPRAPDVDAVAARLPASVRLGTSSWTFPGWSGLVYDRRATEAQLADPAGLAAYAAHPLLRTVGLDRAFYRPLSEGDYHGLAESVPAGFEFLVKAWQAITRPEADERGRTHGSTAAHTRANALFLDVSAAEDLVIAPALLGMRDTLGPVVFQFPPLDLTRTGPFGGTNAPALRAAKRIGAFVRALGENASRRPSGVVCAIEVRSRAFFEGAALRTLAEACRDSGWAIGMAGHPSLPPMHDQARAIESIGWAMDSWPGLVCRWLLRRGHTYEGARRRYSPFDRIVDPDPESLSGLAGLCARAAELGRPGWIIINNKAEGSAPISVARLAACVVDRIAAGGDIQRST